MTLSETRAALHQAILRVIAQWSASAPIADAEIDALLLSLFHLQVQTIPTYGALVALRGVTPESVVAWQQIPCAPSVAFKHNPMATLAAIAAPAAVFATSGTTDGAPGRVYLAETTLYDAAALATFRHFVAPQADDFGRFRCLSLVPTAASRPESSLGHMVRVVAGHFGDRGGALGEFVGTTGDAGHIAVHAFCAACTEAAADGTPVLLFATSVALAILLGQLPAGWRVALPPGSRLMDTGGSKGRTLDVERAAQHGELVARFGLQPVALVGEFGMTELSSQRYEPTLRAALLREPPPPRHYVAPPWLRSRVLRVDGGIPQSPCAVGEPGLVAHLDLANLDTCAFVQTADLGSLDAAGGLTLFGRLPTAELRGCGLDLATN